MKSYNEKVDRPFMEQIKKALMDASRDVDIYECPEKGGWYVSAREVDTNHGDWYCGSWNEARKQCKQTMAYKALCRYLHINSVDLWNYEEENPVDDDTRIEFWVCDYLIANEPKFAPAAAKFKECTP